MNLTTPNDQTITGSKLRHIIAVIVRNMLRYRHMRDNPYNG